MTTIIFSISKKKKNNQMTSYLLKTKNIFQLFNSNQQKMNLTVIELILLKKI